MAAPSDFAAFCHREYPRLVRSLDLYLGDAHTAEDLAQEALLRAAQRWGRVSRLQSPGGWTYRVAINLANSQWRRRAARRRAHQRLAGHAAVLHEDPDVADQRAVREAICRLPSRQRTALVLRHYLGLSAGEVGEQLGCSPEAVRALTKRALGMLRDDLGREGADESEELRDVP